MTTNRHTNDLLCIRPATTADIPLIYELADVAFRATYLDILSPDQLDYMMEWMYAPDSLLRQMEEDGHLFYIAYFEGQPAGYVSVQPEEAHTFHLQKIYVLPDYQGRHIGQALFDHAVKVVKTLHPGPCQLRLNVNRNNRALHFYEHLGMQKVDEGNFPIGHGYFMNDYIMGLDL